MKEIKRRLGKLNGLEGRVKALVIFNLSEVTDANFFYFTNSTVNGIFYYDFSRPKIITSQMECSRAKKSWVRDVETARLKDLLAGLKGRIGIDKANMAAGIYTKIRKSSMLDVSKELERARSVKTKYELGCIKKACDISGRVYRTVVVEPGMTELSLKQLIDIEMLKQGVDIAFPTIVASGSNVRYPHHVATGKKLSEPLLVDFGVKYNGYCSDVTRTVGSRFEKMISEILDELYSKISPGMKASEADKFVRDRMGRHAKHFITSLGHGIGLQVHEKPWISPKSTDTLEQGMVFTIEPGIYAAGGIRIENDFVITDDGAEMLTKF